MCTENPVSFFGVLLLGSCSFIRKNKLKKVKSGFGDRVQQKPVKFQPNCFEISAFPEPLQHNGGHISPAHKAENHNQLLQPQQSLLCR